MPNPSTAISACMRTSRTFRCQRTDGAARCVAIAICPAKRTLPSSVRNNMTSTRIEPSASTRAQQVARARRLDASWRGVETRGYSTSEGVIEKDSVAAVSEEPPAHLDEKEKVIWGLLMKELECKQLEVKDVSGGCGSMYAIDVVSEKFRGLNMLKQQRLVNQVLAEQIKGWHGVQLKTKAP
ncbi:hypothetical protein HYFRA_00011714 [Hymenoscyphus fraxineus]|uniref:Bola-like protein n=1 Tax=Hymenoscyphus fraxineus TaxID=746836 RepID=A0A9N9KXU3_9HELO|nr:hypothetical protein HYFRA_00011714 [Hymenoscyphus fraxineus]